MKHWLLYIVEKPIRWSEGSRLGISDAIKQTEEKIVQTIAEQQNSIGLAMTSSPTEDGAKVLERHGDFLPSEEIFNTENQLKYRDIFEKSLAYELGKNSGWRYKVISLPRTES